MGKLNTRRIVKTYSFRFLSDYYGDSLDIMFPQFPNHFLPFSMVFPHVSPSVSRFRWVFLLFPLSASPVSYFRFCDRVNVSAFLYNASSHFKLINWLPTNEIVESSFVNNVFKRWHLGGWDSCYFWFCTLIFEQKVNLITHSIEDVCRYSKLRISWFILHTHFLIKSNKLYHSAWLFLSCYCYFMI